MEDGSVDLVEEAAKTLTQEMAKGSWTVVRGWITQVFQGNEVKKQKALEELEESRRELTADGGDALSAEEVERNWKTRLRRLLREDPGAAAELRAILDEVAPERGARNVTNIARDVHGILIQGGNIHGGVHQHETKYEGDHIDMRGIKAKGDVIGTQHDYGDGRRG
ncbi:hypothetical protein GCM10009603_47100 [Nocardiopsis exhalans]